MVKKKPKKGQQSKFDYIQGARLKPFNKEVKIGGVAVNTATGEIELLDENGHPIELEQNALTTLRTLPNSMAVVKQMSSAPLLNPRNKVLMDGVDPLRAFDVIAAVDAAPRKSSAGRRWTIMVCEIRLLGSTVTFGHRNHYEILGPHVPAERIGWRLVDDLYRRALHERDPREKAAKSVLIVTDHDKGSHDAINNRTQEALPGWKLPEGTVVAHAHDESTQGGILQKAVKMADGWASDYLEQSKPFEEMMVFQSWPEFGQYFDAIGRWPEDAPQFSFGPFRSKKK